MDTSENLVPKVHPLDRSATPDDPFELVAAPAVGDPDVMLECILQEFLWMGWDTEQLTGLFHHPGYPLLCALREHFGGEEVHRRVQSLAARGCRLRVSEVIQEEEPEPEHEPVLVQITMTEARGTPGNRET